MRRVQSASQLFGSKDVVHSPPPAPLAPPLSLSKKSRSTSSLNAMDIQAMPMPPPEAMPLMTEGVVFANASLENMATCFATHGFPKDVFQNSGDSAHEMASCILSSSEQPQDRRADVQEDQQRIERFDRWISSIYEQRRRKKQEAKAFKDKATP